MAEQSKKNVFQKFYTATTLYKTLDEEQKALIKNGQLDKAHSPLYWVSFFNKIATFDEVSDLTRGKLGTWAAALIFVGIFLNTIVAATLLTNELYFLYTLLQIILAGAILIGLLMLPFYFYLTNKDVPNYVREFVMPLLVILNEEMEAEELLHLKIDLRRKDRPDNQTNIQRNYELKDKSNFKRVMLIVVLLLLCSLILGVYIDEVLFILVGFFGLFISVFVFAIGIDSGAKYPRIVQTTHLFPWLSIKGLLSDGTRLDIQIIDTVNKFKITRKRRGSSGKTKIKTKIKYKIRTDFNVRLALKMREYELQNQLHNLRNAAGAKYKHKSTERREVVKINARQKSKDINQIPDIQAFLAHIAKAYQQFIIREDESTTPPK